MVGLTGPLPQIVLLQASMLTAHYGAIMASAIRRVDRKHLNALAAPFVSLLGFDDHLTV